MKKLILLVLLFFAQTSGLKIDLMTSDGVAQLNGKWRYSDARIVDAPPVTAGENAGFASK